MCHGEAQGDDRYDKKGKTERTGRNVNAAEGNIRLLFISPVSFRLLVLFGDAKAKRIKYVKSAAGRWRDIALSIAAAVVNPLGNVWTVTSIEQLLNLIFSGSNAG